MDVVISMLASVAVAVFPVLFLFFQNAEEAHISDVAMPLLIFAGLAVLLFLIIFLITRNAYKAGLCAIPFLLVLLNFKPLESMVRGLVPSLRYWHTLPIFIFILLHLMWLLWKKLPDDIAGLITPILCAVFCGLLLLNGILAIPTIWGRISAERESAQQSTGATEAINETMPNIYFFLFDEYSSVPFMQKYYNYDNSPFTDWLSEQKFSVSHTSHNESIMTDTIMTNVVNLDYVVDNTWPAYEKKNLRVNGKLFALLRENGYTISAASGADFYGLPTVDGTAQTSVATTAEGDTLAELLYTNTAAYPLIIKSVDHIHKSVEIVLDFCKSAKSNQMLMCHLNIPHEPFIYDENGNIRGSATNDWGHKEHYKKQYIYATKLMKEMVGAILKNDPDSIVILQSDHGARASTSSELFMRVFSLEDMSNCFNAVYYRGEAIDIEGLSGVNTVRTILNRLLDMDFAIINVPEDTFQYRS